MRKSFTCFMIICLIFFCTDLYGESVIDLPKPRYKGNITLEETLKERRSVREFSNQPLTLEEISQLLWATQGIKDESGKRTVPSAGALYPLEIYLLSGNVKNLPAGIYKYNPFKHHIMKIKEGDKREELSNVALGQPWVKNASVNFIIVAVYERTTRKYGDRGIRYVHIEVGHAAQNLLLQATALRLGAVPVGAFNDNEVKKVIGLRDNEQPLYIIPVGKRK
ncbi:MAG: SagB/ThcOx family dehydrogenase [Thermodesulfovibrio sp.]|uniref:SagB/ThcOx family dehydrogenase n=1 Tax=Thermodesulfovibrio sp. 1176 TaxID=3043424 RepID=UPI0024826645|nr:SagB/ThcOx family dehydrogenase [Thermodesulfovibrio sp. 1176]MDI1471364.1 SagB/ThcOx family dehydrogenase [Thermodesulfovibrio sp. 1176]MDI6714609.1 SagB/ThcOx family dehydrogenase [Thermodesulfovibrio sp.]